MSLSAYTSGAEGHTYLPRVHRHGNSAAVALIVAAGAVATFDLYLFATAAIR